MQCNQHAEFFNIIPGGTYSKRSALKGLTWYEAVIREVLAKAGHSVYESGLTPRLFVASTQLCYSFFYVSLCSVLKPTVATFFFSKTKPKTYATHV